MGELLYCGEVEKWASTARGKTWRRFFIRLTNRKLTWHIPTENDQNVFLGEIEVSRIVNAKIDTKTHQSHLSEPGYQIFIVSDPQDGHEFRTETLVDAEAWVQHIKNATLPKTRRKKVADPAGCRDRVYSNSSSQSNASVKVENSDKQAMVTEILGGIHIERPTDQVNNDLEKSSTFINNSFPQPFAPRMSTDSETDLSEVPCADAPITKEGYLIKQGQKIKSWRRRWFTLSTQELIYRDDEGTNAKGRINMTEVILARRSCKYPDKKFLFEVITKKRTYYMMASSEGEMTSWTEALSSILIPRRSNSEVDLWID